jgi:threonine dehydratase
MCRKAPFLLRFGNMMSCPTVQDIRAAAERIRPYIHRTPVMTSESINRDVEAEVFFKCENFQKVGAFKIRGASNAIFSLSPEECQKGVATHSSGNHAAALAYAACVRGIPALIVMPHNAPSVKRAAVERYGGKITFCEPTAKARQETLENIVRQTGATVVHPYNDYRVIEGQGTAALELLDQAPDLDVVLAPVSGGGLLSGTAIAVKGISPNTLVMGTEPEGADDAFRSLKEGRIVVCENPKTIADGLRMFLGDLTFPIIRKHVSGIITVSEEAIVRGMKLVWERMKIVIEPSSAVPVAALLEKKADLRGRRIGVILTGGNVDLDNLPWIK